MAQRPSINDREFNLWFKIAQNWYEHALGQGASGLTPPNINDPKLILLKKITYYTATLA